jgi:hypothetical protein
MANMIVKIESIFSTIIMMEKERVQKNIEVARRPRDSF